MQLLQVNLPVDHKSTLAAEPYHLTGTGKVSGKKKSRAMEHGKGQPGAVLYVMRPHNAIGAKKV